MFGANSSSLETIAAKLRTPDGAFGPGTDHGQKLNKYSTRRQREAGWLPGVVFGGKARQVAISVETEVVDAARRKFGPALETLLWEMQISGGESGTAETVMVAARQLKEHPVYSTLYSVNWLRVDPNRPLRVNIPVVYTEHDSSPAIKRGPISTEYCAILAASRTSPRAKVAGSPPISPSPSLTWRWGKFCG